MKENKYNSSAGRNMMLIGLLLICSAFILTWKNICDISRANAMSQRVMQDLLPTVETAREKNNEVHFSEFANKTVAEIPDYILNPNMEMPTEEIDGNKYIGTLTLHDIDLTLPIMESWSYENLKIAPCRYTGTAYKKGFVVCAHNYDIHFGKLRYLDIGSEIVFIDIDGNEFHYEVEEIETLQPSAIEEMLSEDWDLTLFTCTIGGASRVTVRCALLKNER